MREDSPTQSTLLHITFWIIMRNWTIYADGYDMIIKITLFGYNTFLTTWFVLLFRFKKKSIRKTTINNK